MQASLGDNDNVRTDALKGAEGARQAFQADGDKYMEVPWFWRLNKGDKNPRNCGQDCFGENEDVFFGEKNLLNVSTITFNIVWQVPCFFCFVGSFSIRQEIGSFLYVRWLVLGQNSASHRGT